MTEQDAVETETGQYGVPDLSDLPDPPDAPAEVTGDEVTDDAAEAGATDAEASADEASDDDAADAEAFSDEAAGDEATADDEPVAVAGDVTPTSAVTDDEPAEPELVEPEVIEEEEEEAPDEEVAGDEVPVEEPVPAPLVAGDAGETGTAVAEPAAPPPAESGQPLIGDAEGLTTRWRLVQVAFVDEPRQAVQDAHELVSEVAELLARAFAEQRALIEAAWGSGDDVSTEDLRLALRRYRDVFHRLLDA